MIVRNNYAIFKFLKKYLVTSSSKLFKYSSFGNTISIEFLLEKPYDLTSEGLALKDWIHFFKASLPLNEGDSYMTQEDGILDLSSENFVEIDRNSCWYLPLNP
jgi:hypothetical protein